MGNAFFWTGDARFLSRERKMGVASRGTCAALTFAPVAKKENSLSRKRISPSRIPARCRGKSLTLQGVSFTASKKKIGSPVFKKQRNIRFANPHLMLSMRKTPANYGWENLLLLFDAVNEAADRHTDARTARHTGGHVVKSGCPSAKPMLMPISIPKIIQLPLSSVFSSFLSDMFFLLTARRSRSF